MTRRILWIVGGLFLLGLLGLGLSWSILFPPSLPRDLAIRVPPDPLFYVQGSRLHLRVEQFTHRPEYAAIQQSAWLTSLNQTEWWSIFRKDFLAFWKSLIIDPMHIVGHETAFAIYPSEVGEILPRAILVGKTDQVARIAERLMYGYDRLAHQIGVTFLQEYRQHSIYQLQTPDMLWPLYYAVVGEAGLISTSLPLLYDTIPLADFQPGRSHGVSLQKSDASSVFRTVLPSTMAENRVLSGYLDPDRFAEECQRNPFLRMLGLNPPPSRNLSLLASHLTFAVEVMPNQLLTRFQWFSAENASESSHLLPPTLDWQPILSNVQTTQPLVMTGNRSQLSEFLQYGQRLFPLRVFPFPTIDDGVYGERLACRVSDRLTGILYMLPETLCMLETKKFRESQVWLDTLVDTLIASVPPLISDRIIRETMPYHGGSRVRIALKMPLMQQEILHYTITDRDNSPLDYTIVSNSQRLLTRQLDEVLGEPKHSSETIIPAPSQAGFLAVINPIAFSEVARQFSQTPTFALIVPPQSAHLIKHNLPLVLQGIQLLPVTTVAGGVANRQLTLEVRMHPEAPGTSAPK